MVVNLVDSLEFPMADSMVYPWEYSKVALMVVKLAASKDLKMAVQWVTS